MRILVTNDDGVYAPGIRALAIALSKEHDVLVAAPDAERSGQGHAFTIAVPLRAKEIPLRGFSGRAFAINGTPVDCVKLGACNLMETPPDMVVSGINSGANLGTDVLYSGTASAAMEGGILGIPSLAMSLASHTPSDFSAAAEYAVRFVRYLAENPLPNACILNVNVPNIPLGDIKGVKACPLSRRMYNNNYVEAKDPRGGVHYWLPSDIYEHPENKVDSDEMWIENGFVTATPVTFMITAERALEGIKTHGIFNG